MTTQYRQESPIQNLPTKYKLILGKNQNNFIHFLLNFTEYR